MSANVSVIEVLGPGCPRCHETHRVVRHVVEEAHSAYPPRYDISARLGRASPAKRTSE